MYYLRYYAIGHSYLKHGPFPGWQTQGSWGMAASNPSADYFHQFQQLLKENMECEIEAVAENHANYERLCAEGVTREDYENSDSYAQMQAVIRDFQPNIITIFIGGGNTIARDAASLSKFYDVLFEMVHRNKQPETVVICVSVRAYIKKIIAPFAEKYHFLEADASIIHEDPSRENPYYAFKEYPEYDQKAAQGAVEFRTHPGDRGHRKIAECIFEAAKEEILRTIPENGPTNRKKSVHREEQKNRRKGVLTEPAMELCYEGFNITEGIDGLGFSSAPGTGASVSVEKLGFERKYHKFFAEMSVEGEIRERMLKLVLKTKQGEYTKALPLQKQGIHRYEYDLSDISEEIQSFRLSPDLKDCFIKIRAIGFTD